MNKEAILDIILQSFKKVCVNDSLLIEETYTPNDISQWTSLNHMLIIADIEQHLHIKFKLHEAIASAASIQELLNVIISKLSH